MTAESASLDVIFKAYDIRGVYPDELDETTARAVGNAFVAFTGAARVLVGRDARPSSEPLVAAFLDGATLAGADVVDLGLASTDLVYFASGALDAPAAMFTASHNPAQYNGIKLCRAAAAPVGEATGLTDIKARIAAGQFDTARGSLRTWVLTSIRNRAIDYLRGRGAHERREREIPEHIEAVGGGSDPWMEVAQSLEQEIVRRALQALPREQRQAIELAYFGGFSQREIAAMTRVPLSTVKGRMRLGLEKLHSLH